MKYKTQISWQDPTRIAEHFSDEQCLVLLYSGIKTNFSGSKSFLGLYPKGKFSPKDFEDFASMQGDYYFGFIEYEFPEPNGKTCFYNFHLVLIFDHENQNINIEASSKDYYDKFINHLNKNTTQDQSQTIISKLKSHFKYDKYIRLVESIKTYITLGEVYQANLTNKFYGYFSSVNPSGIFRKLVNSSPSVYSCYIKFDDLYIISSSPELFLRIDNEGRCESRPIKGTARRSGVPKEDENIIATLHSCPKNRSENLMITDLMRNDFNRVCLAGSVKVPKLFEISSYATLHHMSSTIVGRINPDDRYNLLKSAFPPGSMTGAPKIASIKLLKDIEILPRGIYSGAIGYILPDKTYEFSVAIRTLIINGNYFEFQVGGGITIESIPEEEFNEIITKSLGIIKALGLTEEVLLDITK